MPKKHKSAKKPQSKKAAKSTQKREVKALKRARQKARRVNGKVHFKGKEEGGALGGIADTIESVVPSIWKGVRSMFNFKESSPQEMIGAVPAAYNTVIANQMYDGPELPVLHPSLGLRGISFEGSQYLCQIQLTQNGSSSAYNELIVPRTFVGRYASSPSSAGFPAFVLIPTNPWNFGGRIAFRSWQYQRFRFEYMRIRLVSTCSVNTPGTLAVGYYKDYARGINDYGAAAGISGFFGNVADLVPSLSTPHTVAQAQLTIPYEGNELYYMGSNSGLPWNTTDGTVSWGDAQNRQEQQGAIVMALDSFIGTSAPSVPTFNVYLDYRLSLYDPEPAQEIIPASLHEVDTVVQTLRYIRGGKKPGNPSWTLTDKDDPERVSRLGAFLSTMSIPECKEEESVPASAAAAVLATVPQPRVPSIPPLTRSSKY